MGMIRDYNPNLSREEMIKVIMNNQRFAHVNLVSEELLNNLPDSEVKKFYEYSMHIRVL